MKFSKLFCLVLSVLIVLFAGCGSDYSSENEPDAPPNVIPADNPQSYYNVIADENLSEEYKIAIVKALNEWATKTSHTFKYELSFVDMTMNQPDYTPHTIKIYVRDPGPGYVGWTSWSSSKYAAYTFVRPSITGETFRLVMLHELGHAFNLHFGEDIHYQGPNASVMYPSIGQSANQLCCPELRAFCDQFGCQAECNDNQAGELINFTVEWLETQVD